MRSIASWRRSTSTPRRRSTRSPTAYTSCVAGPAPPISKNAPRGTESMPQPLNYLKETASQTAGPYVHIGLIPAMAGFDIFEKNFSNVLATPNTQGERITLEGKVLDGSGSPLRDVLLEIWQANASGRYNHPADRSAGPPDGDFRGWGRAGSDFDSGLVTFDTIKPGAIVDKAGRKCAPHV